MVEAERRVTLRDYLIFVLKLFLDGMKDGLLITLSTVAVVVDVLSGGGKRPRLFYSVLRMSERFDLWLNLNGAMEKLDSGLDDDGLFGASEAGADSLLGKLEQMVRGGDRPRSARRRDAALGGEPGGSEPPGTEPPGSGPSGTAPRGSHPSGSEPSGGGPSSGPVSEDGKSSGGEPAGSSPPAAAGTESSREDTANRVRAERTRET